MISVFEYAFSLSNELHKNQKRKDGITPYTQHTQYVGNNVYSAMEKLNYSYSFIEKNLSIAIAAGYLHDSIEDCISASDLFNRGSGIENWGEVVDIVKILSRDKEKSIIDYLTQIKNNPIARAVKITDLTHNMSDLGPCNLRDKYELCMDFLIRKSQSC